MPEPLAASNDKVVEAHIHRNATVTAALIAGCAVALGVVASTFTSCMNNYNQRVQADLDHSKRALEIEFEIRVRLAGSMAEIWTMCDLEQLKKADDAQNAAERAARVLCFGPTSTSASPKAELSGTPLHVLLAELLTLSEGKHKELADRCRKTMDLLLPVQQYLIKAEKMERGSPWDVPLLNGEDVIKLTEMREYFTPVDHRPNGVVVRADLYLIWSDGLVKTWSMKDQPDLSTKRVDSYDAILKARKPKLP